MARKMKRTERFLFIQRINSSENSFFIVGGVALYMRVSSGLVATCGSSPRVIGVSDAALMSVAVSSLPGV